MGNVLEFHLFFGVVTSHGEKKKNFQISKSKQNASQFFRSIHYIKIVQTQLLAKTICI